MISFAPLLLQCLLSATVDVAAGADLQAALSAARPGDLIRLGPGEHQGSLGRLGGPLRIVGAGAGVTWVIAPEGEDGLVVEGGAVSLTDLGILSSGPRAALKVLGGEVSAEGVVLAGGAVGAFVDGGRLEARDVDLSGGYGLLVRSGEVRLADARVRGSNAGVAQLGGHSELRRLAVTGPATEAGVTISGGTSLLEEVVIRAPGPSGLSVQGRAQVEARSLEVSGATEAEGGFLGDCIQARRGELRLMEASLTRCGGAALEAMGGAQDLRAVDAVGGVAGCLVFLDGATARLEGNRCIGRGPGVVSAAHAQVSAAMDRWMTDPVLWVECGSGARVRLGPGEAEKEPCRQGGEPLDKPARP
jgi:hypothetical protein